MYTLFARHFWALFLLLLGVLVGASLYTYSTSDPGWMHVLSPQFPTKNILGSPGAWFADVSYSLLGYIALILPIFFLFAAYGFVVGAKKYIRWYLPWSIVCIFCAGSVLSSLHFANYIPLPISSGGLVGLFFVTIANQYIRPEFITVVSLLLFFHGIATLIGFSWIRLAEFVGNLCIWPMKSVAIGYFSTAKKYTNVKEVSTKSSNIDEKEQDYSVNENNPQAENKKSIHTIKNELFSFAYVKNIFQSKKNNRKERIEPIIGDTNEVIIDKNTQHELSVAQNRIDVQAFVQKAYIDAFGELSEDSAEILGVDIASNNADAIERDNNKEKSVADGDASNQAALSTDTMQSTYLETDQKLDTTHAQNSCAKTQHTATQDIQDNEQPLIADDERENVPIDLSSQTQENRQTKHNDDDLEESESTKPTDQQRIVQTENVQETSPPVVYTESLHKHVDELPEVKFEGDGEIISFPDDDEDLSNTIETIPTTDTLPIDLQENIQEDIQENISTPIQEQVDTNIIQPSATKNVPHVEIHHSQQNLENKNVLSATNIVINDRKEKTGIQFVKAKKVEYIFPSVDLLFYGDENDQVHHDTEELQKKGKQLEKNLLDFGIKAQVIEIHPGPVITRYEIIPAPGVKVVRISNLVKDIARSMSVVAVRIVEVIHGKSTIGIEVPNHKRAIVRLAKVIDSPQFYNTKIKLPIALGFDIQGKAVVAPLEKMPHLLVAGTTGSGKSVGVNAMLLSLLYKRTPEQLRLLLIDPKMLELSVYNGIAHLLAPVVTDMKDAANVLRWCVAEMDKRYMLMSKMGVRNLDGYNKKVKQSDEPIADPTSDDPNKTLVTLPHIVVIIDEFADMMMIVGKKVEELIARIAQKARAAGIHMILATQRPSVDVITGLIKANVPTRIAFQVSSKIDSRTILDQSGAEQLLGQGDMLFMVPGQGTPQRVHGAFVSDDEVHRVVEFWKNQDGPSYIDNITHDQEELDSAKELTAENNDEDQLYAPAVAFVLETRKVSISSVQRKFKIGYNRAARIIDLMEERGVVSPMETNGRREIIQA